MKSIGRIASIPTTSEPSNERLTGATTPTPISHEVPPPTSLPTQDNSDLASYLDTPVSPLSISYHGPSDCITKSTCIVISGFPKTIGSNGEIAKATHSMMSSSKIKHLLTSETNKNIQPEFHSSPNVCGYYPLELSEEYSFRCYPQSSTEKLLFHQLKFQPANPLGTSSHFYHHFMAYALPVSPQDFRNARTIGAFGGVQSRFLLVNC